MAIYQLRDHTWPPYFMVMKDRDTEDNANLFLVFLRTFFPWEQSVVPLCHEQREIKWSRTKDNMKWKMALRLGNWGGRPKSAPRHWVGIPKTPQREIDQQSHGGGLFSILNLGTKHTWPLSARSKTSKFLTLSVLRSYYLSWGIEKTFSFGKINKMCDFVRQLGEQ